jgi:hypothetical protein
MNKYGEAFDYLSAVSRAFREQEAFARAIIEELHAAAKRDLTGGLKVVGRSPDELFLTFAGIGIYFRFVYSTVNSNIEFGSWLFDTMGQPIHSRANSWEINRDGKYGEHEGNDPEQPMYIALAQVMKGKANQVRVSSQLSLSRFIAAQPPSAP